jgi:hypothetical protein
MALVIIRPFMKFFIFLLLIILAFPLEAGIQNIPEREAKKIKGLFEYLLNYHDFAYVVFGSKPMALADICLWVPEVPVHRQLPAHLLLSKTKERLKAWYQYKKEFKFNDFIFLDQEEDLFRCLVFVLIHKPRMLSLLHAHEAIFKKVLGDSFNPETFLNKIEKREISLAQAIHHHQGLLGIMLGYGVVNSMLFQEKDVLYKEIEKRQAFLDEKAPIYKKLQQINSHLQAFNEFEDFSIIMPLHFAADPTHPETITLKKRYKTDQVKIAELMKQPYFVEKALEKLEG